jgi:MFS family permease
MADQAVPAAAAHSQADAGTMRKVAGTALAGTSIEWYDFFLYGTAAALVFPTAFFPEDMPAFAALIASFGTFAVGFVARPIGGVVFGHFGDKVGRKRALVTALMMMGVATTLIGCLPTYAMAGATAPVILVLLRFVQGLAVGGQWGGAMLLVTENAPPSRRGFYGAFAQAGVPVGMILANLAFLLASALLSEDAFFSWGWRVPFLSSIVLIALSLYVQLHLEDTPAFRRLARIKAEHDQEEIQERAQDEHVAAAVAAQEIAAERAPSPVIEVIRRYPRQILLGGGAFLAVQVTYYILVAWIVAYGSNAQGLGLPRDLMLAAVLISSVVQLPAVFLAAAYSDRRGRRGVYMLGAVLGGIWAFALFPLVDTGNFLLITLALSLGQVFLSLMYGPQAAFLAELFSTRVRYSGVSLGYQLGAIAGGALAPTIATALWAGMGNTLGVSGYIALASALTLVSVLLLGETSGSDLHADD